MGGNVYFGETPLCALVLVLANGQQMFSCNENLGIFGLDVPVDQNGNVTLMKALNPALTPPMFDNLLSTGQLTNDLGATGRDDFYGHGLIDAHKAVVAVGSAPADAI